MEEETATITFTREELRIMGEIIHEAIQKTMNYDDEDDEEIKQICKDELRILNSIMRKGREKCSWLT
jgi:phage regulator Rha-like protein